MIWGTLLFAYLNLENSLFAGKVGYELNNYLQIYIGKVGVFIILLLTMLVFLISKFKLTPEKIKNAIPKGKEKKQNTIFDDVTDEGYITESVHGNLNSELELNIDSDTTIQQEENLIEEIKVISEKKSVPDKKEQIDSDIEIVVENPIEEEHTVENLSNKLVEDFGEFDPRLELANYKFPTLNLLRDYRNEHITIDKVELENNKNKIVETLNNYSIGISSIKATIGPTVTLYEIVPNAGIRISKIKNLEDDIALSLSALGIRIIAPIPGKGTIGIEVPNKKPSIVSMKSVLSSQRFQDTKTLYCLLK